MSRSIFRRIILIHIIIFVLAVAFNELYITSVIRENYIDNLKSHLSANIGIMQPDIPFGKPSLDAYSREMKKASGARITIIAPDGRVLGDSDGSSGMMDNHAGRIEIMQAMETGTGSSIRYSDTLKYDFLYLARRIQGKGFIRMSVPLVEVDETVNRVRVKIIIAVLGMLLVTLSVSAFYMASLRSYLRQIRGFSHCMASGAEGQRLYITGAREFEDITDDLNAMSSKLHNAFSSVESERNRLGVILSSLPDALIIIDNSGIIQLASRSASALFSTPSLTGRQYLDVVRNHDIADIVDKARASGAHQSAQLMAGERYLYVKASPLFFTSHELSGFVIIMHDITKERQLEEVRRDFIANVSHELKTPVTAIKGFAETLLDGAMDDKANAADFLRTIQSNAGRMDALIDDLMTISRLELGVARIEKQAISIEEAILNVAGLLLPRAKGKGLAIETSIHPDVREVMADRNRLIQVLTNLADNAIKFTEKGSVTIGTGTQDGSAFLFVRDTGIGIPQKHLPRLGERFYRVDPGRSRSMGGTGLGLSIVKHIVRAHGWAMRIESAEGRGTTVYIMIHPGSGQDLTQS